MISTDRLVLRRPEARDAEAIFSAYSNDARAMRYMCWRRHTEVSQAAAFIETSHEQWAQSPAGPYLIESRATGEIIGATGLSCREDGVAETGYILSKAAWGKGYATEALAGIVQIAAMLKLREVFALCHAEHTASWRVLEKCGFSRDETFTGDSEFPNFRPGERLPVVRFVKRPG
jgi:ribosomal-protein-alanine N-acetyltransferase